MTNLIDQIDAACWFNRLPGNPHRATGASKPCILGAGHYA